MSQIADNHRARTLQASDILPRARVEQAAAVIAREVIDLTYKGLDDPEHGFHHISDAARLAQVLDGLTGYVAMFERNP